MAARGAAPRKPREPLTTVVARLEGELLIRQRQLAFESERNAIAKARIGTLGALSEAHLALQLLSIAGPRSGRPDGERAAASAAAAAALQRLDELVDAARRSLAAAHAAAQHAAALPPPLGAAAALNAAGNDPANPRAGAGPGLGSVAAAAASATGILPRTRSAGRGRRPAAPAASAAAAPPPQTAAMGGDVDLSRASVEGLGCCHPASKMAKRIVSFFEDDITQHGYMAWWKEHISQLSQLLEQRREQPQAIEEALATVSATFSGLYLSKEWFPDLMLVNFDTGAREVPPDAWWSRVAEALAFSPQQVALLDACNAWSQQAHSALRSDCAELASRALQLPAGLLSDPGPGGGGPPPVAGLGRVQLAFRSMVIAHKLVAVAVVIGPEQLARTYVGSYPHLTSWTEVLQHAHALAAAAVAGPRGGDVLPGGRRSTQ